MQAGSNSKRIGEHAGHYASGGNACEYLGENKQRGLCPPNGPSQGKGYGYLLI
jgi:hypothetical protein